MTINLPPHVREEAKKNPGWTIALSIVMILLGIAALFTPVVVRQGCLHWVHPTFATLTLIPLPERERDFESSSPSPYLGSRGWGMRASLQKWDALARILMPEFC